MALQSQRPVLCRRTISANTQARIRPVIGGFSRSSVGFREFTRICVTPIMLASSGYSRKRPRRSIIPKTKSYTLKGFAPRPQVGSSTQKKEQRDVEENESSESSSSSRTDPNSEITDDAVRKRFDIVDIVDETVREIDEQNFIDAESDGKIAKVENEGDGLVQRSQLVAIDSDEEKIEENISDQFSGEEKQMTYVKTQIGKMAIAEKTTVDNEKENKIDAVEITSDTSGSDINETIEADDSIKIARRDLEESLRKEKEYMDAQAERQLLENLADENFLKGNRLFVVPQVVTPDQVIRVFLNRSLSSLANEPDVLIKGAYNGWRWKFFTERLRKSDLKGDWWSCELSVPKQAYRVDFVFFNGANKYENNSSRDFSIIVDGGMAEAQFEDFLIEENRKELERVATEQAEKKRQAEEQRQKEAEKAANEADRAQLKLEMGQRRNRLHEAMKLASESARNIWQIEPSLFKGGDRVKLYYNRSSRPLNHATEIWIHGGHNTWSEGLSIIEKLSRSDKVDGDWWCADVVVPDQALVIDWVFADGPPGKAVIYDNNGMRDFHNTVPMRTIPEEEFWVEEEHRIFKKIQEDRRLKEVANREKVEKNARIKAERNERTMKAFLLSQKHIVYTEPIDVQAGCLVNVLYNPSNTVLNGKPEVWFRCSFNRWKHRTGPLPPQKMVPAENGPHLKATVNVPMDAYIMDFVFSEKEDDGIYDNRNGMDYHIPVTGGIIKEPPMHIVHIAVEMAPIAKVGGLGDVVTSLSRAVQDLGHTVDVILPKYNCMDLSNVKDLHHRNNFAWGGTEIKVWLGKVMDLSVYFLEPQNEMFSVGCIYGRNDDGHRFGFFCHSALEFLLQSGIKPDILHCHDWSSASVAWLFKEHYIHYGLSNARVVFTIHNLEFGLHNIGKAMQFADKATTVSKTYSREVAGNNVISPHLQKFHGIVNGIDPDIWDPYNDHFIPMHYTAENVVEGKKAAKEALQQRLGLRKTDIPLVGIISRLTVQKGIHLIKHGVLRTLEHKGQVVLLGSAPDHRIQNDFTHLANELHNSHAGGARFCLTYDEPLSHLIYAGADFILVPSIFEPCGLTQLIAMRYGSIPIVRKTGGLYDTVFDVDQCKDRAREQGLEPNGFSFEGTDSGGLDYALNRAISAWFNARDWINTLCKRVMEQDWSWSRPALDYMELYHSARK